MEECELCGRKADQTYVVEVEGVELRVCSKCAKGKKATRNASVQNTGTRAPSPQRHTSRQEMQVVDNYGERIRDARVAMKIPLKVLAEMLNEKETFLSRVESEKTSLPEPLARKLEKALSIKLLEEAALEPEEHRRGAKDRATLGDFVERDN
jgi:putative transcription factor